MTSPGYGCALGGEDHKVNWLITHLNPAMTISLCDDDFPVGIIPVLASELGVDQGRLYDTIKRFTDREQARQARAADDGARKTPWPVHDGVPASCVCGAQPDEFGGLEHAGDGPHEPAETEATS